MSDSQEYVHGYSDRENDRLCDQANALMTLLHGDTRYPEGARVLEAGCGVGAQTVILAANNPMAHFTSIDLSPQSVEKARETVQRAGFTNVEFEQGDIFNLRFPDEYFDHVFVCFVLEHLPNPCEALASLRRVVKKGGTITVIEGDHGSAYFHPDSEDAKRAIQCLIDLQARAEGNSLIGRQVYPLLVDAGFSDVSVSPRMVYVDGSRPDLIDGFTCKTFTAMVEGVGEQALASGLVTEAQWLRGISDLYRTAAPDGVFCYTFFKGVARR